MPARAPRSVFSGMVDIGEVRVGLGPEPIGRRDDSAHVDGRVFVAAGHGSRQCVDDKPNAFLAGFSLGGADESEQAIKIGVA